MMTLTADIPIWLWWSAVFVFGALWGSFFNVAIYRWPRGMSVVRPRSQCVHCGHPVEAWRNIPIFGWLFLRGKTACCHKRLSPRYAIVEFLSALLALAAYARFAAPHPQLPLTHSLLIVSAYFFFFGLLLVATFIDLEWMQIPDEVTLPMAALGLSTLAFRNEPEVIDAALGSGLGFFIIQIPFVWIYEYVSGHAGMGEGDSRLMLGIGAFLGVNGVLFALAAGSLQGVITYALVRLSNRSSSPKLESMRGDELENFRPAPSLAVLYKEGAYAMEDTRELSLEETLRLRLSAGECDVRILALHHEERNDAENKPKIPFGPFLSLAALEYALFGPELLHWYFGLVGFSQ